MARGGCNAVRYERIRAARVADQAKHLAALLQAGCRYVIGFGNYLVSASGSIYSLRNTRVVKLSPATKPGGYLFVGLVDDFGCTKYKMIHRLVAEAFIPNPSNLPAVNHRNGDKRDNGIGNLEWCTHSQNTRHAFDIGLLKRGVQSHSAKLAPDTVRAIRSATGRYADIGRQFGVCAQTVCNVKLRRNYTDVP